MGVEENKSIGVYSWVTLVIFLLTIIPVIRPFKIPIGKRNAPKQQQQQQQQQPARRPDSSSSSIASASSSKKTLSTKKRRRHLYLNLATAPPLAVLILLVCGATNMTVIKNGLVGSLGVEPYSILILFYSLAYICVSLDMTGIFQFLAFRVSKQAGSRGRLAFTLFYILTSLMSGLTSNDVVILTGTAFLAYFTRVSGILPTAFMMSEFTSANIASMALFIGNPTNVVVATAYNISFLQYSAWMLLPTIGGLVMAYVALRVVFRKQEYLPRHVPPPDADIDPTAFLIDRRGAYFGIGLLVICLLTLIGTSFVHGVAVWMVTLPFAVFSLFRDLWYDYSSTQQHIPPTTASSSSSSSTAAADAAGTTSSVGVSRLVLPVFNRDVVLTSGLDHLSNTSKKSDDDDDGDDDDSVVDLGSSNELPSTYDDHNNGIEMARISTTTLDQRQQQQQHVDKKDTNEQQQQGDDKRRAWKRMVMMNSKRLTSWWRQKSTSMVTLVVWRRLPWTILPFSLGMFVLVEILSDVGWTGIFASGLVVVVTKNYMAAVVGMLVITIVLCQLLNNLPTTILLTRVIQHDVFAIHMQHDPAVKQAVLLGLIAGSNLGACLTLVGSLAGIMFEHILKTKGIYTLGYFQFVKWNLLLLPSIVVVVSCILILELYIIFIQ
ncbi:arsenical pump membrane protein-domain-containing protein [Absidia repens]|uniref:Arsenical pump membrane protein-domain-containing protein n=1 Tax=Absidia repens TaxID=90262 RepID=A0A1X2IR67_9FUNG|nr:arsenical pump membrane protein-domain-containing protein [Absidia repens]